LKVAIVLWLRRKNTPVRLVAFVLYSWSGGRRMVVIELAKFRAPWPLILAILLLQWTTNVSHSPLGFADYFAGAAEQSKALIAHGITGHTHDIVNGAWLKYCFVFLAA
jgi:hypothetical protein